MFRRVVGPRAAGAYVQLNLALVARLAGDPAEADLLLGNALARMRAAGDEGGIAQALAVERSVGDAQGDTARAREALRESLVIRRRLGDVRSVGLTLALLAELAAGGGDLERGGSLLRRALAMVPSRSATAPRSCGCCWALARVELARRRAGAPRAADWRRPSPSPRSSAPASCARGRSRRSPRSTCALPSPDRARRLLEEGAPGVRPVRRSLGGRALRGAGARAAKVPLSGR